MGGAGGGGVCCTRFGWPLCRRDLATAGRPVAALQLEPGRDVADVVLQRLGRQPERGELESRPELRHQILGCVGLAAEALRQVAREPGRMWLRPSVGNWSFPCQSHYWIDNGRVRWAGRMSARQARRRPVGCRRAARGPSPPGLAAVWTKIVAALKPRR